MSGRCSPTDALNLLIPAFAPMEAAAELTRAVHDNRCRIIGNGTTIKSDIAPRLMVVAQPENDGRWTARIVGTFALGGVKPTDVWEFEIDEVKALLPQPDTRGEALERATAAAEEAMIEAAAARADLEQARAALQAATEQMGKAQARAEAAEARAEAIASETTTKPDPEQPRRRPGPKPEHPLWRLDAAAFAHQFFNKKKRGPSAGEVAEHLQIKYDGWEPPESDIRAVLRFLIHD